MQLSVVVPTLNGREELATCLDALTERVPDAEVVVVNGPSADGTTGMVRERTDVDVLVEVADRTVTVARNAGIDRATGDVIALLDRSFSVEDGWLAALRSGLEDADVVTGPTHQELAAGMTTEAEETDAIGGRSITYFNPGNVAFDRRVLDDLDGFDEYLETGGDRDLAHRVAAAEFDVAWRSDMAVRREFGADGGVREEDWTWRYRALAYREVKNYGARPSVIARVAGRALRDAAGGLREVGGGDRAASEWLGTGREVCRGAVTGWKDGLLARRRDGAPRRNPNGRSMSTDRAVEVYELR